MYPHPLDENWDPKALTYPKCYHHTFITAALNKPNWTSQVADRSIVAKWLREAHESETRYSVYGDKRQVPHFPAWNASDIRYVWQELANCRQYVELLRAQGCKVEPDARGTWKGDGIVGEELRRKLIESVGIIENISAHPKGRDAMRRRPVLDLIDPGLWPIMYGRTRNFIDNKLIRVPPRSIQRTNPGNRRSGYSHKFCWLPSEFEVSADGKKTKIFSYINNFSPLMAQQGQFYSILEDIFTCFVPLFNHVLADLLRHQPRGAPTVTSKDNIPREDYRDQWENMLHQFEHGEDPSIVEFTDGHCSNYFQCQTNVKDDKCPEICHLETLNKQDIWTPPHISSATRLEGRNVKVIVKLSNINLTPEIPRYQGSDWHTDATLNERIIATGIYYYAQENITDPYLDFMIPESRVLGGVLAKDNRAVAYPNILEHRARSFELIDKTKPGYQKMLIFFLCDPSESHKIPTTRTVAPQQPEEQIAWLTNELRQGKLGELPEDVFKLIVDEIIDAMLPPLPRKQAEAYQRADDCSSIMRLYLI
ncbi:hypothetical protein TWF281_004359 [Arthrobotrys megalospora]